MAVPKFIGEEFMIYFCFLLIFDFIPSQIKLLCLASTKATEFLEVDNVMAMSLPDIKELSNSSIFLTLIFLGVKKASSYNIFVLRGSIRMY